MNKNRAEYMWPIIKAFAEGKIILWKNKHTGEWEEAYEPDFEVDVEWKISSQE